ncbi:MAG: hypothetical protein MPJ50_01895 [Pirellulales bacterium]|nr:hypothetical protein [Pirellulales bacterium]
MGLITGDEGKVLADGTPIADITGWTFRTSVARRNYSSSKTDGYERSVPGAVSGRGAFGFQLDLANPLTDLLEEGSQVTLQLHVDASRYYGVPALIEMMELDVDVNGDGMVGGRAEFTADGAWTKPDYS